MKNKLGFLTSVSLNRKVKNKWFLAANILLALIIIAGFNIDTIITAFGGDFNEKTQVYVIDNTNEAYNIFKDQVNATNNSYNMVDTDSGKEEKKGTNFSVKKYDKSEKEVKKLVDKEKKSIAIIINSDEENTITAKLISKDYLSMTDFQIMNTAINGTKSAIALKKSNVSPEELAEISAPIKLEREYLQKGKNEKGENSEMIMGFVFPLIILPFFMLTMFLVQMIGAEVNDEKTTRGMEIIISNVSPKTHFFSKVLAGNLFVLIQGGLLFLYSGLGLLTKNLISSSNVVGGFTNEIGSVVNEVLKSGIGEKLIYIIPLTLILMVLTFVAYSLLAGILASMTTNIEDFQQLQTPIIVISLIGYFLAVMSSGFSGSLFIKVFSYIPFISAILSPSLLMMGEIGIADIIVSIILTVITNMLLIKYGLKIYKVGILNYSSKGLWKKMLKALKD